MFSVLCTLHPCILRKVLGLRVGRVSSEEHLLLFQRTWVQFPAPMLSVSQIYNSTSGIEKCLWHPRTPVLMCTYPQANTQTHSVSLYFCFSVSLSSLCLCLCPLTRAHTHTHRFKKLRISVCVFVCLSGYVCVHVQTLVFWGYLGTVLLRMEPSLWLLGSPSFSVLLGNKSS